MNYYANVYKLYLIVFFHNLIPAYVIERLFWEQRGMTVFMVVLCEGIYALTLVILEIPSGILADKLGRKKLLIISGAISSLEFILLLFSYNFWHFAFVVLLAGISGACSSGSFNALLYESLLAEKKEKDFEKVLGRKNAFDFIGAILAALSGSMLANIYDFEFNYILSAGSMMLAFLITMTLKESPMFSRVEDATNEKAYFLDHFKSAITFFKGNPKIVIMLLNGMVVAACVNYLDEFWQLYLDNIGLQILYFGLFSAVASVIRIPGNLMVTYLLKRYKHEKIIIFVLGMTSLSFTIAALFPGWIGIIAMILIFLISGVVNPLISGYLHHRIKSNVRATIDSFQSLIERALIFIIGIGFGIVSSRLSIFTGYLFLGFTIFVFLIYYIVDRAKKRIWNG